MCNAISEAYSLYNDGKEVLNGNYTKLPEAIIEANRVLSVLGATKTSVGKNIKNGYDFFIKNGHAKATNLGKRNTNPIAFVMGLLECKKNKDEDKVKIYSGFLTGFGAKVAVEGFMDSKCGEKLLQKVSNMFVGTTSEIFKIKAGTKENFVKAGNYIVSGLLYPIIADKVFEKISNLTETVVDKIQDKKKE